MALDRPRLLTAPTDFDPAWLRSFRDRDRQPQHPVHVLGAQPVAIKTFAGGTLVGVAPVRPNSHGPTRVAITGGTGSYEGARGSILSVPNKSNENVSYDTIHLLP